MHRAVFTLIFIALLCGAARAADPDYEIKLVRTPKVGQKYTLTAEGAVERKTTVINRGEKTPADEDGFGVHLEGTVEVLAVNKDGEEGKVTCKVTKCTRLTAKGDSEMIAPGRIITATGGKEDTTFSIDQGELSDDAKEALDLVLRMGEDDGYNDDKIYGTTKRQPVGGTWSIDKQAASDEAKADDVHFDPKDITGTLKLEAVEKIDGVDCLRISGTTEIKKLDAKPPKDMEFVSATLKAHYTGMYPIDTKFGSPAETMSVVHTATFRGKTKDLKDVLVESKVRRAAEQKRKFLDDKQADK